MPPHRRLQAHHSLGSPELSPVMSCTPTVASLATTDLRVELERRHSGEDDHTSIERRRERRRNLEDHYDTTNAAPVGHATHSPSSPGTGGGCVTLAPHPEWWFGHASSGLTYRKNTTGLSISSSSCRITPPPSSLQEGMRSSWPTTFLWP
jgi:hypothetical protein